MIRPSQAALVGLVACAAALAGVSARAQDSTAAQDKEAARASALAKKARTDVKAAARPARGGAKKVIKLDTLTVEGRIQKPEAFYVLPRSNLSFDELQKSESFVPKIEKSAQKDPF